MRRLEDEEVGRFDCLFEAAAAEAKSAERRDDRALTNILRIYNTKVQYVKPTGWQCETRTPASSKCINIL